MTVATVAVELVVVAEVAASVTVATPVMVAPTEKLQCYLYIKVLKRPSYQVVRFSVLPYQQQELITPLVTHVYLTLKF